MLYQGGFMSSMCWCGPNTDNLCDIKLLYYFNLHSFVWPCTELPQSINCVQIATTHVGKKVRRCQSIQSFCSLIRGDVVRPLADFLFNLSYFVFLCIDTSIWLVLPNFHSHKSFYQYKSNAGDILFTSPFCTYMLPFHLSIVIFSFIKNAKL